MDFERQARALDAPLAPTRVATRLGNPGSIGYLVMYLLSFP